MLIFKIQMNTNTHKKSSHKVHLVAVVELSIIDLMVKLSYQLLFQWSRVTFTSQFLSKHGREVFQLLKKKMEIS